MDKPKCLDLFCKAGGMTRGYQLAGFHVTGVDIEPQPRYIGDEFIWADVMTLDVEWMKQFDLISASPPCQRYSVATPIGNRNNHPDLIEPVRKMLERAGRPYVIENVPLAPLKYSFELCGVMFGLKVYRHRRFETSFFVLSPPHQPHPEILLRQGAGPTKGGYMTVCGHFKGQEAARAAMGIDWMNRDELAEAIPPAYSQWIGEQFLNMR
jgi:DNA (cytosine-5)-methyltransferase 1